MFSLLIVDDEAIIAAGIKSSIDWKKLGFSKVEIAHNMRQAKEAYAVDLFDVMICDIEMPRGTGFDLFTWVREYSPKTECIFLTCHAEFEYAKKAVQLGSLDYLLKPVLAEELMKTLEKAVTKIWQERGDAEKLLEQFWCEVLRQEIPARSDLILKQAERQHLFYTETTAFIPTLVYFDYWEKELSARDENIMLYALRKAMDELVQSRFEGAHTVNLSQGEFVILVPLRDSLCSAEEERIREKLKEYCQAYIQACNHNFYGHLSCLIGKRTLIDHLAEMYEILSEVRRNQVNMADRVILIEEQPVNEQSITIPNMKIWCDMLQKLEKERLIDEIHRSLESWKDANDLNVKHLQLYYQSFLQAVLHTLQQTGLRAENILHEHLTPERTLAATRSVRDLQHWASEVIEIAVSSMRALDSNDTIVEKIRRYIELHLDEELSRQYIADHVGLSPDYVVKMFKKEMGQSISDFILQQRMSRAKELLVKSDMSISDVALSIGCMNFSYFSTLFRKETSMTPQEFRKQYTKTLRSSQDKPMKV